MDQSIAKTSLKGGGLAGSDNNIDLLRGAVSRGIRNSLGLRRCNLGGSTPGGGLWLAEAVAS